MANIHIRNAGQEREEEPMISQKSHERILESRNCLLKAVAKQRDEFHGLALKEGQDRIKLEHELERIRSAYRIMMVILAMSMAGNIGLVAFG